ncbi:MAG TPA: M13 family metallopeptidase, partial [Rhodopila sp.]|nr:M13 family metallopeptidase [Rhodopila sp.]
MLRPLLFRLSRRLVAVVLLGMVLGMPGHSPSAEPSLHFGTWGYDADGGDSAIRPGDDFYAFANGTYLAKLAIPPDRPSWGVDQILAAQVNRQVRGILESEASPAPEDPDDLQKARTLYRAFLNQDHVDRLGLAPLAPDLAAIRQTQTKAELAAVMGRSVRGFQTSLFDLLIDVDAKHPDRYAVIVCQSGLGMPDRDYYLQPEFTAEKRQYRDYMARMLTLAGWPDPDRRADDILDYETRIADASWTVVEERDPDAVYFAATPQALAKVAPGFDWMAFLDAAGLAAVPKLVVHESTALPRLASVYAATSMQTLRAWAAFHLIDAAAPYLARPFTEAHFAFHDTVLEGQQQPAPRWEQGVGLVNDVMGEAVGRAYVAAAVPPGLKAEVTDMVAKLRAAFAERIRRVGWMSDATKQEALKKLSALGVKVGYPDKWRDYARLEVRPDDLYGDVVRAVAFEWDRELADLDRPVDRDEWDDPPQLVDASYNPVTNMIELPAAILQAPYFDPRFDAAANYGAIGMVIGHEMTHGFDDEGRAYDATGALADWWTKQDVRRFEDRAARLAAQYDQYEPYPGVHVNGMLTNGENIADLSGILVALDAYHRSARGRAAPVIDGLTGDQRFFLAFAQSWREKRREQSVRQRVVSDPHAPDQYRVNGVLRNVDEWYGA